MTHFRDKERGQTSLVFVVSLVIIIGAFALLVDGGRYLVMRNRARMMADASALAGAGMLDVEQAQQGNFVLEPDLAKIKAKEVFILNKEESPEWAGFRFEEVRVQKNEIWVTITGGAAPLFGSLRGLHYTTTIVSSARAASGISSER
jgi:hypothetical protein